MAPLQVINAGFGRTGTDSMREALNILGYNTHHMKSFFMDPTQNPEDFYNAYQDPNNVDWDRLYANYNAAVDWPTASFYKELMVKYPDAKILLTVRSADSWYTSVKNTIHVATMANRDATGVKSLLKMNSCILDGALADPEKFKDEEAVKKMFTDHNEEVQRVVPSDNLLVLQTGEGWDRLCAFLGKDVPDVPYPRANSTEEFQKNFEKRIREGKKNEKQPQ